MAVVVECAGRTDPGLIREDNEDQFLIGDLKDENTKSSDLEMAFDSQADGPLMIVCDGMGGAKGGKVASEVAAAGVWQEMKAARKSGEVAVHARVLRRSIRAANHLVRAAAKADPDLTGMGTTVSVAGLVGEILLLGQVGDSRAYIHRGTCLTQVTRDQSVVSALVSAGQITQEQARNSEQRSLILQALGTSEDVDVALSIAELRRGDRLLLCSDGLHGVVSDTAIEGIMTSHCGVADAAERLIAKAREAGGPDNITVVVARFDGEDLRVPLSMDDLPRFTEFNPMEEGHRALTNTSHVARRLAKRAGLQSDSVPPGIPATGQHQAILDPEPAQGAGPAEKNLTAGSRLSFGAWIIVALAVIIALVLIIWW